MGYLFDFITGGNIKVASSSLAKLHYNVRQNYLDAYCTRIASIIQMAEANNSSKLSVVHNLIKDNSIKNYVDLVVLDLNIFTAPVFVPFNDTYKDFHAKIVYHLNLKGIPRQYINGDNSSITKVCATEFSKGITLFGSVPIFVLLPLKQV